MTDRPGVQCRMLRLVAPRLPRIALAAVVAAAAELAGVALLATATWLLSTAAGQPPITTVTVAIVAVRSLAIGRGVARYIDRLLGHDAVLRALADLRAAVFRSLAPTAPAGSHVFRGGDLLTRLVSDVDAVQDLVLRVWVPMATFGVVCLAAVGFTACFSPAAAAVLAAGLAVAAVALPLVTGRLSRSAARRAVTARGEFAAIAVDLTVGARDLAAHGATAAMTATATDRAAAVARTEKHGAAVAAVVTAIGSVVAGAAVIAVLLVAGNRGVMTAVLAITALVTVEAAAGLPDAARRLGEVRASCGRVLDLLDTPPAVPDPVEPLPLPTDTTVVLRGARPALPGRRARGGVDLDLPPGRRVAILGASGAGKTMLLNMLVRFTDVDAGTVTLGGTDLRRLSGDAVRGVIGGMLSPDHLFDDTVRANLLVADPNATDADLRMVADRAGLTDLELSTMVGPDGGRVSGGQRQRLLLARALLADHAVLLLDEPTEHLDPVTAATVRADILAATADRTVVMVTHSVTGLDAFDEVLVLDEGTVIDRGEPAEMAAVLVDR